MIAFIDGHRVAHGVEPACKVLLIGLSNYRAQAARRRDPAKLPDRAKRDAALMPEIARVFEDNFCVCGVREVWRQLKRESHDQAPCTVASVMCGCPLRVKAFERGGGTESTGAVMCPASNAAGMAAGPDELRGASA